MRLRFLGKVSSPEESPTLYATGEDSYVVQGWIVTDPAVVVGLEVPEDETLVEVPPALFAYLRVDGLDAEVGRLGPPIVKVAANGNYIVQGKRVTDSAVLSQMRIPEHETCVHVTKTAIAALLVGG